MTIKQILDGVLFLIIYVFALSLIEHTGGTWIVETAGDLFGALALMLIPRFIGDTTNQ